MRRPGTTARDRRAGTHHGRFVALALLVALGFAGLVGRLGQVQLVGHDDFRSVASSLDTRTLVVPALRGRILDREGAVLADNRASTVVTIERRVVADRPDRGAAVVREVAAVLGMPADELLGRTWLCGEPGAPAAPACWAGSPQVPVPLADDVDPTKALSLVEQPDRFPGIGVESRPVRVYPRPLGVSAAQALGYLGPVRAEEVAGSAGLTADDLVGRAGLEQQYDAVLRGTPGRTVVAVDPRGLVTGVVSRTDPVPGRDLVTSLDARVQAAAERALATQMAVARNRGWAADSGAVVVLDPRTGSVATLLSAPAYDPNVWAGGISAADYDRLSDADAGTPLLSRAIGVELAPASTIKPASVTAAVRAGNPLDGTYDCPARVGSAAGYSTTTRLGRTVPSRSGRRSPSRATRSSTGSRTTRGAARAGSTPVAGRTTRSSRWPPGSASGGARGSTSPVRRPAHPDRTWKRTTWEATKRGTCARPDRATPRSPTGNERRTWGRRPGELHRRVAVPGGGCRELLDRAGRRDRDTLQMAVMYAAIANGGTVLTPRVGAAVLDPRQGNVWRWTRGESAAPPCRVRSAGSCGAPCAAWWRTGRRGPPSWGSRRTRPSPERPARARCSGSGTRPGSSRTPRRTAHGGRLGRRDPGRHGWRDGRPGGASGARHPPWPAVRRAPTGR